MESGDIQKFDDEITVDLGHFVISILKKWRSLVVLVLIGAMLGAGMQWMPQNGEPEWSREDAALVEQMKVAASARTQYGELERYVKYSPFMRLDSQNVYTGSSEYYVSKCDDPDQVAASFNALFTDETARNTLCSILGISNELDLDKMIQHTYMINTDTKIVGEMQVQLREKISLHVDVFAANKEQAQKALEFLCDNIEQLPVTVGDKQEIEMVKIAQTIQTGVASDLRNMQNELRNELNEAHKNYTLLEKDFTEEEYALYEEYVLTGKTSRLPAVLFPSNPLKKPVVLAFIFGFLGCAWYAVAYFLRSGIKTAEEVSFITRRNILAFINTSAPRKCGIDRWLDGLEAHSFPDPVPAAYAAAAIEKLGKAVVVYDETNADLRSAAQELGVASMGLVSRDPRTLSGIDRDTNVVLLVKLGTTTKMQIRRETVMCRQYGIPLAGSVLVK